MNSTIMSGAAVKADNGSGRKLCDDLKGRRFHDSTQYRVFFNGISPDPSNIVKIVRSRKGGSK